MPNRTVVLLFKRRGRLNAVPVYEGKQRRVATKVFRALAVGLDAMGVTCRIELRRGGYVEEEYRIDHTKVQ